MFDDGIQVLLMCICAAMICLGTWEAAHRTVATDCLNLGSFYVSKTVFKCEAVK